MTTAINEYVFQTPEGGWRVAGTRVSLDSVVHEYLQGRVPEAIVANFPSLTLEQVHGALAFYLKHRAAMDAYLAEQDAKWEELRRESEAKNGPLLARIRSYRSSPAATKDSE
jgi:uncharacterized protein (DUF433 family)